MKPTIAVLTGAGISAESGLATFRDSNGLWANHRIEDVCTPEAWERNPQRVLDFYNQRRTQAAAIVRQADVFLIIGTSLQVYPANTLAYYARPDARIIVLDPHPQNTQLAQVEIIRQTAAAGVPVLCQHLIECYLK